MNQIRETGWQNLLSEEFNSLYFNELISYVDKEYNEYLCFPKRENIFRALELCPPDRIHVVILGQDPYHGESQADGLCFSVPDGVKIPPSLRNIMKEIKSDTGIEPIPSGNLDRWAKQGVLLLNATLTVRAGEAGSHQKKGWEKFTDAIIQKLSNERSDLVFMLWGNFAQKKGEIIDSSKHLILKSAHPSPLSAHNGFFGNHHFSQSNNYLNSRGKSIIDWS